MHAEAPPSGKKNSSGILKQPEVWAATALMLGFCLPWIGNPVFRATGYHLARVLKFFGFSGPVSGILIFLTFMIPVGGVSVVMLALLKKSMPLIDLLAGMIAVVVVLTLVLTVPHFTRQSSAGVFVTLLAAVSLILIGAIKQHHGKKSSQ